MKYKLSDRIRPNYEAAPWVVEEVKKLEILVADMFEAIKLANLDLLSAKSSSVDLVKRRIKNVIDKLKPFVE